MTACTFCGCDPCEPDGHDIAVIEHSLDGHDGEGWYIWSSEYPDEGSVGAFPTKAEAERFATENGYLLDNAARVLREVSEP